MGGGGLGGSVSPATSKGFVLSSLLNALPALKGLGGFFAGIIIQHIVCDECKDRSRQVTCRVCTGSIEATDCLLGMQRPKLSPQRFAKVQVRGRVQCRDWPSAPRPEPQ